MTHDIFGFNDPKAIKDSIDFALWEQANLKSGGFIFLDGQSEVLNFIDDLMSSALMKLSKYCGEADEDRKSYPISLFREVSNNMIKDFNNNKYIYWYLLYQEERTRANANLEFLGTPEERIIMIKEKYQELWGKPYDK